MNIIRKLISNNFTISNNKKIEYIVIHYTAGITSKRGAAANTASWFNNPSAKASAHYIVDDEEIVQAVEDINIAWHCGGKSYKHAKCRNNNSIGIEICSNHLNFLGYDKTLATDSGWFFTQKSKERAAELTAYLMHLYNIPIENVIRHYDVTGKDCPSIFVDSNKEGEQGWTNFKALVLKYYNKDVIPDFASDAIKFFISKGYIKGETDGHLNFSYSDYRLLTILYRVIKGEGLDG